MDSLDGEVVPDERAQREEAVRRPKAASSIQRTGNKITGIDHRRRCYGQNLRYVSGWRKVEIERDSRSDVAARMRGVRSGLGVDRRNLNFLALGAAL